jgi:hypothetical protein
MKLSFLLTFLFLVLANSGCSDTDSITEANQINFKKFEHQFTTAQFDILERAEKLIETPPVSIIDKPTLQHLHDKRTYVSLACYWWPDPGSDGGMPYIRIDGEVNPETRSNASDLPKMIDMAFRIEWLSSAYQISGNEQFAEKAIEQIKTWFVNSETSMMPHLYHAQMVKGLNQGRSYGVIDTWWLVRVVESVPVLRASLSWTPELELQMKNWFTHYLNWLRNSEFGQQEMKSSNNHGTWYDVQVVTFALFTDQKEYARYHLNKISKPRIARQIGFTGRQKQETRRPRPEHYSIYNLSGWLKLASVVDEIDITLDDHNNVLSGNLKDAVEYLIELTKGQSASQYLDPLDRTDTDQLYLNLLLDAWRLYDNEDFKNEALQRFKEIQSEHIPVLTPSNYSVLNEWLSSESRQITKN